MRAEKNAFVSHNETNDFVIKGVIHLPNRTETGSYFSVFSLHLSNLNRFGLNLANHFRAGLLREAKMCKFGFLTFCTLLLHIFVVYVVLTAILSI